MKITSTIKMRPNQQTTTGPTIHDLVISGSGGAGECDKVQGLLFPKKIRARTNKKFANLYHKVNHMMAVLGADGEVNATQDEVCEVMSALAEIDGGVYNSELK